MKYCQLVAKSKPERHSSPLLVWKINDFNHTNGLLQYHESAFFCQLSRRAFHFKSFFHVTGEGRISPERHEINMSELIKYLTYCGSYPLNQGAADDLCSENREGKCRDIGFTLIQIRGRVDAWWLYSYPIAAHTTCSLSQSYNLLSIAALPLCFSVPAGVSCNRFDEARLYQSLSCARPIRSSFGLISAGES